MSEIHEGGCLCGTHRYRVKGDPMRVLVCHCRFCQRRTGAACGIGVLVDLYFDDEKVAFHTIDLEFG